MPKVFDQLSATQLDQLDRDRTVFFFAVGPVEDHGPHLPMGLDGKGAVQLAFRIALKLEEDCPGWVAVLMPTAPLGIDSNTSKIAVRVRPHVLRDFLVDISLSLTQLGFRHFACFSGHLGPRQLAAIEDAGVLVRKKSGWRWSWLQKGWGKKPGSLVSASSALVSWKDVWRTPFAADPAEHGGAQDTALALAIDPASVDPAFRALLPGLRPNSAWKRQWLRVRRRLQGYWGSPAEAQAQMGEAQLQQQIDTIYPKLRAVWEGASPDTHFRSGYSLLPTNSSFFAAYFLAFWVLLVMLAYVSVTSGSF